jgi:hypothetical protein
VTQVLAWILVVLSGPDIGQELRVFNTESECLDAVSRISYRYTFIKIMCVKQNILVSQ